MIEVIKNLIGTGLRFAAPIFLVVMPCVVIYGFINPWPPSQELLSKYPDSIVLLSALSHNQLGDYVAHSKSYVLINPHNFSSHSVKLSIDSNGHKEIEEQEGGFLLMLASYLFFIATTWWSWFRRKTITRSSSGPTAA